MLDYGKLIIPTAREPRKFELCECKHGGWVVFEPGREDGYLYSGELAACLEFIRLTTTEAVRADAPPVDLADMLRPGKIIGIDRPAAAAGARVSVRVGVDHMLATLSDGELARQIGEKIVTGSREALENLAEEAARRLVSDGALK